MEFVNKTGERAVAKAIRDPENNKRMLRSALAQSLRAAEGSNDDDLKRLIQEWAIYIIGGEHLSFIPTGIHIPVRFLNVDFWFLHIHKKLPILLSTVISFFGFNARNVKAAIQQRRVGKAIFYSFLTICSPIPLPLFNTLYWETLDFLKQNAKRKKITQAAFQNVTSDTPDAKAKVYQEEVQKVFGYGEKRQKKIDALQNYHRSLWDQLSQLTYRHNVGQQYHDKERRETIVQTVGRLSRNTWIGEKLRDWKFARNVYHVFEHNRLIDLPGFLFDHSLGLLGRIPPIKALTHLLHISAEDVQRMLVHEYLEMNERFLALADYTHAEKA